MFRPVGSQPPAVYWRRRLVLLGSIGVVVVLLIVTLKVVFGNDSGATAPPSGQGSTAVTAPVSSTTSSSRPASHSSTPSSPTTSGSSSTTSTSRSTSTTAEPPAPCALSQLAVQAVTDRSTYHVGATPHLMLQVTNSGKRPCVQDLADQQIELLVYNGASRVWGSHDCKVLPGTDTMTLNPAAPVRVTVIWSGKSSVANTQHSESACGPRQAVGAGTYTLYAKLSGKTGKAAQFSIS